MAVPVLWKDVQYLIIDEISMVSREFFATIAELVAVARESAGMGQSGEAFGGLNMILVGDFYQFPPVVSKKTAPLYWPVNLRVDTEAEIIGRRLYEQFRTVVILREQVRVTDPEWVDLQPRVRPDRSERGSVEFRDTRDASAYGARAVE